MKNFLIVSLMIISVTAFGQGHWDSPDWRKGSIGFGCGYNGGITDPVMEFSKYLLEENYDTIMVLLLTSGEPATQFMAAFVAGKLDRKQKVELSREHVARIDMIKNSPELVPVCGGCTYWTTVPVSALFHSKKKHIMYSMAEDWFKVYYQK